MSDMSLVSLLKRSASTERVSRPQPTRANAKMSDCETGSSTENSSQYALDALARKTPGGVVSYALKDLLCTSSPG
jgi:hypothetical protein